MASDVPDEPRTTEADAETIAMRIKRKRSRRVSFADTEITSVHIFNRDDEDSDQAPDSAPKSSSADDSAEPELGAAVGFFKDVGGESDDFKDSDDEDDGRKSFLRPLGSPSPMSSAPGSATSNNDEDDFFGPVSADFIRAGISDSAASDDFHETTMDTTAFSLHYRSLARSDFGGDLKTPTSFRFASEEKTPTHNSSDSGSLMALAKLNNLTPRSLVPVDKVRGGEDSNDMSIIEENPHRYDYGRLSPRLDALLAEGSKNLHADAVPASIGITPSKGGEVTMLEQNGSGHRDLRNDRSTEMGNFGTHDMSTDPASVSHINLSEANDLTAFDSSNRSYHPSAGDSIDNNIQTPNQLMKGPGKENSLKDRNYDTNTDFHSVKEGSIFMLSTRGQQSVKNTPNLARHSGTLTSSSKHMEWHASIQKRMSGLRIPESSPRASSVKDGIEKLRCRLPSYPSPNSSFNTALADISKDLQRDFNRSPTFLEKQVGDLEKRGQKSLVNTGTTDNENPVNISKLGKDGNSTDTAKYEVSRHYMLIDTILNDELDRPVEGVAPPSQLLFSGSKLTQHLLVSENNTKGTIALPGINSLLGDEQEENLSLLQLQSEYNFQTPSSSAGILNIHLSSPGKRFRSGLEPQSKPNVCRSMTEPSLQTPPSEDLVLNMEGTYQSPPRKRKALSPSRNTPCSTFRKEPSQSPGMKETAMSPSWKKFTENSSGKEPIQLFTKEERISSPIVEEPNHSLFLKELTLSPFRPFYAEHNSNIQPIGEESELNSKNHPNDDCYQGLHISQSPLVKQHGENSFGRKRGNLDITLQDGNCTDKIPGSQRSAKVHRSENYDSQFPLGHSTKLWSDRVNYSGESSDTIWKSWTDILVKFSGDSKQLLSPLTSNLNLKGIRVLEDILIDLLKAKKYEMLRAENRYQEFNCISARDKRVAKAQLLLYRLAYEKANLQLMHLKRQKLQSRVQLLSSSVQESQMLKLNFSHCQSEAGKRETAVDDNLLCSVNHVREQEALCDNVSTMRQEHRASDEKLQSLSSFFCSHIKLKGEQSYANTISLVHDHLKTRTVCRLLRQELQSWDVDEFENKNGQYSILLSYRGYIIQRFTGNVGPRSHIVLSKKLNNVKIMQAFPNIGALVAFNFVLAAEATKGFFYSRCLVEETQVTRSLLCNLLDVAEEVQLARFEIVNLMQTSFDTPSDDQLDLQLSFLNFKSCRKFTLSLDMTCLKRGVYPSEILPYKIQAFESAAHVAVPQSLLTEIISAAEGLEPGFTRIMRLCKCISQVV